MIRPIKLSAIFLALTIIVAPMAANAANVICQIIIYGDSIIDSDCDGIADTNFSLDTIDNCPFVKNGDCDNDPVNCNVDESLVINQMPTVDDLELRAGFQLDWNHNGIGDACEDSDGDSVMDYLDNCKMTPNKDQDPFVCTDTDRDRVEDPMDNCVVNYNPSQLDTDGDGVGDTCDNCLNVSNSDQNPKACSASAPVPAGTGAKPSESLAPNGSQSTQPFARPDQVSGNGGCELVSGSGFSLWTVFGFIAAIGIAAIRRKW